MDGIKWYILAYTAPQPSTRAKEGDAEHHKLLYYSFQGLHQKGSEAGLYKITKSSHFANKNELKVISVQRNIIQILIDSSFQQNLEF